VTPRASRTVPYVSTATGMPLAMIAARCMAGKRLKEQGCTEEVTPSYFSVKEAVFPFAKFPGVDTILGPEMKSTGEVMGIGETFGEAFVKSQLAAGVKLPRSGRAFISVRDGDKLAAVQVARDLVEMGFTILATRGTADYLEGRGLAVERVNKVAQGRPHIVDRIKDGGVDIVFNTTEGWQSHKDSASIRAAALTSRIPYFTTASSTVAVAQAIAVLKEHGLEVRSLQDYYSTSGA
jgi:carbamoyl-phosphate synthase large subunit